MQRRKQRPQSGSQGLLKKQGFAAAKADIIAHSMGGLVTREYCFDNQADCQNKIRRFITIATPRFGSELADLLLVYRDDIANFPGFPMFPFCKSAVKGLVDGNIPLINKKMDPHPIYPRGGAIDDLATGILPAIMQAQSKTYMGRWADLPPLSNAISTHTIVGLTTSSALAHDPDIVRLWSLVLPRCGIARWNLFTPEIDLNDRIVKQSSQQGNLTGQTTSITNDVDHFTVRNSDITVTRIKNLLDEKSGSGLFTK